MLKRIFPLLMFVLTILYIFRGSFMPHVEEKKSKIEEGFANPVQVQSIRVGQLSDLVEQSAELLPMSEIKVTAILSGRIQKIYVKEGDKVAAGDPLIKYTGPEKGEEGFFDDLIVHSPVAGVVSNVPVYVGVRVDEKDKLVGLSVLNPLKLILRLPDQYYSRLKKGMTAQFKANSYPDQPFKAKLVSIQPQVDSLSRTAYVEFQLDNTGQKLVPGMFGSLSLDTHTAYSGLLVPIESIFVIDHQAYVFVADKNKALRKKVNVIFEGVDQAVVSGEVSVGQSVLTVRADALNDGDEIVIVK